MNDSSRSYDQERLEMVRNQLESRDISDQDVLEAFKNVPREQFVNQEHRSRAYDDRALPTSSGQTISQPYMVATMTEALDVSNGDRVLEIGTGSGYQTAILVELGANVFTVEQERELSRQARQTIERLGHGDSVSFKVGDGTKGWEEHAPYDGIIVTAGAPSVPESLKKQTAVGGRIVIPVGSKGQQTIHVLERNARSDWEERQSHPCVFVPLVGEEGWDSGKR